MVLRLHPAPDAAFVLVALAKRGRPGASRSPASRAGAGAGARARARGGRGCSGSAASVRGAGGEFGCRLGGVSQLGSGDAAALADTAASPAARPGAAPPTAPTRPLPVPVPRPSAPALSSPGTLTRDSSYLAGSPVSVSLASPIFPRVALIIIILAPSSSWSLSIIGAPSMF